MHSIDDEVVERCVALVRRVGSLSTPRCTISEIEDEARAIVALLPEPLDPDLAEAERLLDEFWGSPNKGSLDLALAALKRGRALTSNGGAGK